MNSSCRRFAWDYHLAMVVIATLLIAGMLLLISEIFLPGMIAGFAGFICLTISVIMGFQELGPTGGGLLLMGVLIALVAGFVLWLQCFPKSSLAKPFVSEGKIGDIGAEQPELVGKEGVTFTPLRPSGTAIIDQRHVDVVTEGDLIDKEVRVKVVEVEGMRIVVRKI
ncbi:MAG: hypothetical protein M2R45_01773 [Verrucomicrobia subdivision 3 bacterium]|nr:hypothetical protein [Limisphaerales bacterium]MCS1415872.1 hypothetical protein [Limisphaerales bacterium]